NISVTANAIAQADIVMSSNSVPDAPQSFSGTVVSTAQVLWTWSDVATETSYALTDSVGNLLHPLGANTTYYFEDVPGGANSLSPVRAVRAQNAAGNSPLSTGLALYTKAIPPVLSISAVSASGVTIEISSATNRMWLMRSTAAVGGYAVIYASTTASPVTSRADIGLNPGTTYYYKAVNFNAQNLASEFSDTASTVTSAASGYYVSGTVNYPGLMSGNITVQRSTSSSMANVVSLALAGNTTQPYYLSGLASNTSYYLRAFIDYNADGARHAAEDSSVIVGPVYVGAAGVGGRNISIVRSTAAPVSPSGLAATPGFQRVTLQWNASASANLLGYEVLRSTSASFLPFTAASGNSLVSGVSFTDLSPLVNTPAYYRVRAVDWGRNRSLPASLSSPVTVTAGGSIVGTIYAVDTATAGLYHVRVSTTPDAGVPSIADMLVPLSPSTYTITGLPDGTYYLRGYRDVNSDFKQDRSREPSGTHGGIARPFDLFVTQGNTLTGVNMKVCNRIPLAVGVSSTVALSSTTCEALDRGPGYYTRIFTFEAGYGAGKVPPGSQVTVSANSAGIGDTFLYLVGPSGDVVASDDDSGGDRNSRIQYTVPAAGVYLIEPTSYSPGMTGSVEARYEVTGGFAGQIAGTLSYSGSMTGAAVVQIYASLSEGAWPIRTSTAAASSAVSPFEIYGLQDGYFY
ncbi:MAG TPA: PPC domain-containing protein, partial [Elusimicrobiales bacterium]|nr:PPC domain-containing protein [Elusimicrobiales bacterium]